MSGVRLTGGSSLAQVAAATPARALGYSVGKLDADARFRQSGAAEADVETLCRAIGETPSEFARNAVAERYRAIMGSFPGQPVSGGVLVALPPFGATGEP